MHTLDIDYQNDIRRQARKILTEKSAFACCPVDVIDAILSRSLVVTLQRNEMAFRQGDYGDHMLVVISGALKVTRGTADGGIVELGYIKRGALIGEIAMFDGGARTADVTALELTKAVAIFRNDLKPIMQAHPDAMFGVLQAFCSRLRRTNSLAANYALGASDREALGGQHIQ
jgi:CRP/FNR family transcriptional regulator, cyclic AMP receptor protein